MKYWTEILVQGKNDKEPYTPCGSDTYYILDGRNNFETMVCDGINRCNSMKHIHKNIIGFKLMRGTKFLKNETCIKQILF